MRYMHNAQNPKSLTKKESDCSYAAGTMANPPTMMSLVVAVPVVLCSILLALIPRVSSVWPWGTSTPPASADFCSSPPPLSNEGTLLDVAILGCGPAGVQAALYASRMNLSYVVVERGMNCAHFFDSYPRRGDLISFNKPNTPSPMSTWSEDQRTDYKLKFDWHSMLATSNETRQFTTYTNKFYPRAEVFVDYMDQVVSENNLNVMFNTSAKCISQPQREGQESSSHPYRSVQLSDGSTVFAKSTVLATGLAPRTPSPTKKIELERRFPNAKIFNYEDAPMDCDTYTGKYVVIFGNGNAATELSTFIVEECAATRTWVLGRRVLTPSHMSHYVGNVRTHNMVALESYQLKSLDVVSEEFAGGTSSASLDNLFADDNDKPDRLIAGRGDNIVVIYSGGFTSNPNVHVGVDGDQEKSIFDEASLYKKRYPSLGAFNEIATSKDIYAAGAISHGRDYKESSGGFVHGFRYTVETTMKFLGMKLKNKPWPYKVFTSDKDLENYALARVQTSSALWHLQAFYGDVVIHPPGYPGLYLYIEQIPLTWELDAISHHVLENFVNSQKGELAAASAPDTSAWTVTLEKLLIKHFTSGEFLVDSDKRRDLGFLSHCKTPAPKFTRTKVDGVIQKYMTYFDDVTLVKKCMPTFFERYEITVDGKRVEGNNGDLDVKLHPSQTVVLTETSRKASTVLPVPKVPVFGVGRAVVLFQYGDDFKGCGAVYDKHRAGEGFITPTVYLERDPRTTPWSGTRGGQGSENLKGWEGWDKVVEIEDLHARWRKPKVLPKIWERFFEGVGMEDWRSMSTFEGKWGEECEENGGNEKPPERCFWMPQLNLSEKIRNSFYSNEFGKW